MPTRNLMPPHLTLEECLLPEDFPRRIRLLKERAGLTWDGMAWCLGVDPRQVQRWRQGTAPCGDAMYMLFRLAARVPGGLHLLLPEDLSPPETPS